MTKSELDAALTQLLELNKDLTTLLVGLVRGLNDDRISNLSMEEKKEQTLREISEHGATLSLQEERVLGRIRRMGSQSRKNITVAFSGKIHSPELTVILTRLERLGLVRSRIVPGRGRPLTTYSAT